MDYSGFYKPYLIHIVGIGDDIWSIAKKYDVTPQDIIRLNHDKTLYNLQVGQELKIPTL
jgi:LysM repeat protein